MELNKTTNRIYGLDILRSFAILFVVYGHGCFILARSMDISWLIFPVFDGVSIFFVLSGYLIGGILIKTITDSGANSKALLRFWKFRWYRTLPNYFLILLVLLAFNPQVFLDAPVDIAPYFFFLQNFATPHPGFFMEAWSLSIEEWFYLIVPILLFSGVKLGIEKKRLILTVIVSLVVISLAIRLERYLTLDLSTIKQWDLLIRKQVITRLDSLMYGVLGAYLHFYHDGFWMKSRKFLLIVGLIFLLGDRFLVFFRKELIESISFYYVVVSFSVTGVGTLFLLPYLSQIKQGSGVLFQFFTSISLISYSMYLVHLSLVLLCLIPLSESFLPLPESGGYLTLFEYSAFWLYTLTLSIFIYKYFEVPTTRLRTRF